ncbi:hypothetical protein CW745_13110 [Psychromonas sp. psych-6C06]|uniref:hypothetical protein n=1 Tax=Psychromonas sp. psych-6C06 TaxID=2058089 RepID=UPI000C349794|nr:hypothetical protein [Psychromonas sp. psych-6C06]PKF60807.1 hypothetical protein CW745_13110 [Psychromonas sp. psych-6C06]
MLTRLSLIFTYIFYCIRLGVAPWRYFQLNAPYFNEQRNLFSKLDMDTRIPKQWLLEQFMDLESRDPNAYPVFVKPEWGQNSQGVVKVDNLLQLNTLRKQRTARHPFYLIQQAAPEKREFEVFMIPNQDDLQQYAILSITETCNRSDELFPVNGIYNKDSYYQDCAPRLTKPQLDKIWGHLKQLGDYRIARYGLRADSLEDLIAGKFHIVEVNLYVPMPLLLLVKELSVVKKLNFIRSAMKQLVLVTKSIPDTQPSKSVFFKKLQVSKRLKSINKTT